MGKQLTLNGVELPDITDCEQHWRYWATSLDGQPCLDPRFLFASGTSQKHFVNRMKLAFQNGWAMRELAIGKKAK